jgi:hypothetical protein
VLTKKGREVRVEILVQVQPDEERVSAHQSHSMPGNE